MRRRKETEKRKKAHELQEKKDKTLLQSSVLTNNGAGYNIIVR